MEHLITEYNETGICKVDTDKVASEWNDRFSISQWNDQYRLIEQIELLKDGANKITISRDQAWKIIHKVKLLPIKSSVFKNKKTWRSKSNILSEKERIKKLLNKETDARAMLMLRNVIDEFNEALKSK